MSSSTGSLPWVSGIASTHLLESLQDPVIASTFLRCVISVTEIG